MFVTNKLTSHSEQSYFLTFTTKSFINFIRTRGLTVTVKNKVEAKMEVNAFLYGGLNL